MEKLEETESGIFTNLFINLLPINAENYMDYLKSWNVYSLINNQQL